VNWEVLIIPLIALAVWILGTIFRGLEEQKERDRPARNPDEGGRVTVPPRRPATDLDRFLDEARRRRESSPRRKPQPAEAHRPERTVEPAADIPAPPRPRERAPARPRPAAAPRPQVEPHAPTADVQVSLPVEAPVVVVKMTEPAPPPTPAPPLPVPVLAPPPAPPTLSSRQPSPVLARLREAMKDRSALITGIMLSEILARPVCERRR
jgi:hypothetical protein